MIFNYYTIKTTIRQDNIFDLKPYLIVFIEEKYGLEIIEVNSDIKYIHIMFSKYI